MKAIFLVALTALLVAFASATPPPECPDASDDDDVALFPNPDDCASYYTCIRDEPLLMQCHQGLEYNPVLRICDWPKKNATCKRRPIRPPHQSHASTSKSANHVDIGRIPV